MHRARSAAVAIIMAILFHGPVLGVLLVITQPAAAQVQMEGGWCGRHGNFTTGYDCPGCAAGDPPGGQTDRPTGPTQAQIDARERRAKATALNDEGIAAWNKGDLGIAGEKFQQAYGENPDSKVILNNLANCRNSQGLAAWENGDWEDAAGKFQSASLHNPKSKEFRRNYELADAKRQEQRKIIEGQRQDQRQREKALAEYEKGRDRADAGDWAGAESCFLAAARLYPAEPVHLQNVAWARNNLGDHAMDRGDEAAANAFWKRSLEADPNNSYARKRVENAAQKVTDEQAGKNVAARIRQETKSFATTLASENSENALGYADLVSENPNGPGKPGPFGSRDSDPVLIPSRPATKGTETRADVQLKSAAVIAEAGEDLTVTYDVGGGPNAGSLSFHTVSAGGSTVDLSRFSDRAKKDPEIVEGLRALADLQTIRTQLGTERDQLVKARNFEKDEATMKWISEQLDIKEAAYQANLKAITDKAAVVEKRHRQIDTEVVDEDGAISPQEVEIKDPAGSDQ